MESLNGARVALLEGRMGSELASLVERRGGRPTCVPAVREVTLDCRDLVNGFIDMVARGSLPVVVFLTGAGVRALFQEAAKLGRQEELARGLRRVTLVCRGPKPAAALRSCDLAPMVNTAEPHTMDELLAAMAALDLKGKGVGLVHYGERNFALSKALRERGAQLKDLCLYEWALPEDTAPLKALIGQIILGEVDAVAFTSQVQTRHLFEIAWGQGKEADLARALNQRVVTAAVGPTCAAALQGFGVTPHVVPEHPKMGHLVAALAGHMSQATVDQEKPAAAGVAR